MAFSGAKLRRITRSPGNNESRLYLASFMYLLIILLLRFYPAHHVAWNNRRGYGDLCDVTPLVIIDQAKNGRSLPYGVSHSVAAAVAAAAAADNIKYSSWPQHGAITGRI